MPKFRLTKHPSGIYSLKRVRFFDFQKLASSFLVFLLVFELLAGVFLFLPTQTAEATSSIIQTTTADFNLGTTSQTTVASNSVTLATNSFTATGGTITYSGGYTIHTFTSSGTFTPSGTGTVEYLVVGGGGGGGSNYNSAASGGGGAGGFRTALGFAVSDSLAVTVGAGGTANNNGGNSVFGSITSTGGGAGGDTVGETDTGNSGGSGGGGSGGNGYSNAGGAGTSGQGYAGGSGYGLSPGSAARGGGGGGGAGAAGQNASYGTGGNGGAGASSSITGVAVTYAGGGAGGGGTTNGTGGSGGGGNVGASGTANTGGGGGSTASGGSGIVIVRYLTTSPYYSSGTFTSGIITASGASSWGNLSWTKTGTGTITMKARSCSASNCSGATDWASCTNITSGNALSTGGCVTNGHQYVQYQASLSTADTAVTPSLDDVTITYETNTAPNAPTLVSPSNGSTLSDDTPTLSANYSDPDTGDTGTTNYRIASTTASDCLNNLNIASSGASSETATNNENTTWTPGSSIGPNGTYYWCAQNNDGVATSSWTSMGNFLLDTSSPDIVAVDAGATLTDRTSLTSNTWFKYSDTGSDDQISFSWTDPNSASDDYFYYELNADSGNTIAGTEASTTNPYIDDITISEGTDYFHVKPKNGAGTWGTERTFIVKYDKSAPTNVSISGITADSTTQLTITANTATDSGSGLHSTPYYFSQSSGSPNSSWQAGTSWADTLLSPNTQYTYIIRARDALTNESASSTASSKYTLASQVTSLSATNTTDKTSYKINLTWTNQSQSGMKIEQDTNCDGYETTLYNSTTTNAISPYEVSTSANTCYKFRISSYNGDGVLNTTSIPETSQITTPPSQPTGLTHASNTISSISWDWNDVSGATGYKVYNSSDALLQTIASTTSNWTQDSLSADTLSTVYVRPTNANGEGIGSSNASAYTSANTPTNADHTLNTTDSITWSWSSGGAQKDYYAWTTMPVDNSGWTSNTFWQQLSLTANNIYQFFVKARNENLDETSSVSSSNYTSQNTPTGLTFGTISTDSITLSASGTFANLTSGSAGLYFLNITNSSTPNWIQTNSWTNSSLSPNTQYSYKVKARNGDADETSYTTESAKYTLANAPGTPTFSNVSTSTLKVIINVNANPSSTQFAIYENTTSKYVNATTGALDQSSAQWQTYANWGGSPGLTVISLSENTSYSFKVKAKNGDGTETSFSSTATTTTSLSPPTAPSNVNLDNITTSSMRLNWADNSSNEDGFKIEESLDNITFTQIATTTSNATSSDISSLTPNIRYWLRVRSYNTGGNSDYSTADPKYTLANAPASPSALANSQTQITFSWSANSNSANTEYYAENITQSTNSDWITALSWASTNLTCNTTYSFKVKARNGDTTETDYTATTTAITDSCPAGGIINPGIFNQPKPSAPNEVEGPAPSVAEGQESQKDTTPPAIKITHLNPLYYANQEIIITGTTEPKAKIAPRLNKEYLNPAIISADSNGQWTLNLGRLKEGIYTLELKAEDLAGNESAIVTAKFVVKPAPALPIKKEKPPAEKTTKPRLIEEIPLISSPSTPTISPLITPKIVTPPAPTPAPEPKETPKPAKAAIKPTPKPPQPEPVQPSLTSQLGQGTDYVVNKINQGLTTLKDGSYGLFIETPRDITKKTIYQTVEIAKKTPSPLPLIQNLTKPIIDTLSQIEKGGTKAIKETTVNIVKTVAKGPANLMNKAESYLFAQLTNYLAPTKISNVKARPLSPTSVEITWETNHKATSKVKWGLGRDYNQEWRSDEKVKYHLVILENLEPDTFYHYEVMSLGWTYDYDADNTFRTAP